jgi:hypothetical protein
MKKFDVVSIGSSPKVFVKVLEYAKLGKKCLIINNKSNWKVTKLNKISNIEDGCFFIDYKESDYQILEKLSVDLQYLEFEPSFFYKNKLYPINSNFLKGDSNISKKYRYPKGGLKDINKAIKKNMKIYNIKSIAKDISSIFVDFDKGYVSLNNEIITKKLICGYNLNVDKISSNRSEIVFKQKNLNIFTYLLVEIEHIEKFNFSLIDFSYFDNNNIPNNILNSLVFYQNNSKFIWRVKDITPNNIKNKNNKILCIDTYGWLPKKEYENQIVTIILNYLQNNNLIKSFKIKKFKWNKKIAYSIENYFDLINNLFKDYIEIVNPLFFDKDAIND